MLPEGYGAYRLEVMHNDFVILGPAADPAGIKGLHDAAAALQKIAAAKARFVSRGDDSGTHTKEQELWKAAGLQLETKTTADLQRREKNRAFPFRTPEALENGISPSARAWARP